MGADDYFIPSLLHLLDFLRELLPDVFQLRLELFDSLADSLGQVNHSGGCRASGGLYIPFGISEKAVPPLGGRDADGLINGRKVEFGEIDSCFQMKRL